MFTIALNASSWFFLSLWDKQVYEEIKMLSAIFVSYETKTGLLVTMKIISKVLFITNMFS